MKKLTVAAAALLLAVSAYAAENALFKKLQPLVGTWEATVRGQKVRTVITSAAGGSVLFENMIPDRENMMNAIHPDGDTVMMTHYCAGANQPRYRAAKLDGDTVDFRFVDGTNLGNDYMSGVRLRIVDADHFTEVWRITKDGKEKEDVTFNYTRVK